MRYNTPMLLWSIHPEYLDTQGLVALWREGLLAQKVLREKTKGFKHHPQLDRFKRHPSPLCAIATYLEYVRKEALKRGYHFDRKKNGLGRTRIQMVIGLCAFPASFVAGALWEGVGMLVPFYLSLILTVLSGILLLFVKKSNSELNS